MLTVCWLSLKMALEILVSLIYSLGRLLLSILTWLKLNISKFITVWRAYASISFEQKSKKGSHSDKFIALGNDDCLAIQHTEQSAAALLEIIVICRSHHLASSQYSVSWFRLTFMFFRYCHHSKLFLKMGQCKDHANHQCQYYSKTDHRQTKTVNFQRTNKPLSCFKLVHHKQEITPSSTCIIENTKWQA